ncbi:MAG: DUF1858 domain-containing protein [Anaerolineales bacterium]|nr:DUF1858 domain-containing protein [Anaerolineales bacterium]MCX7755745.1 DUF1858 domain-containing protein [Anaerolineales bacterium]MDW8277655.1 DUF1858 domain-containing protein [Anaerolineales bacterium]
MEITPQTKLFDLLEAYPFLETQIVNLAPPFENLKNPVLRRTVGRLATLEKVAQVGGLNSTQLVNTLRRAVGQEELHTETALSPSFQFVRNDDDPDWTNGEPQFVLDAVELLRRGEVPLAKVNELLNQIEPGRFMLLVTNFEPTPMFDALRKQQRRVFHKTDALDPTRHLTFIS